LKSFGHDLTRAYDRTFAGAANFTYPALRRYSLH
jgi:hypothetical protein